MSYIIKVMDELDEIRHKEEDLFDDLIDEKDKQRHRHPLFLFIALIALVAVIFFAIHFFLLNYPGFKREVKGRNTDVGYLVQNL